MNLSLRIAGIPAQVEVTKYSVTPPDRGSWASDIDFYGQIELEFNILDRRGRSAPWLERKLSAAAHEALELEITSLLNKINGDRDDY